MCVSGLWGIALKGAGGGVSGVGVTLTRPCPGVEHSVVFVCFTSATGSNDNPLSPMQTQPFSGKVRVCGTEPLETFTRSSHSHSHSHRE